MFLSSNSHYDAWRDCGQPQVAFANLRKPSSQVWRVQMGALREWGVQHLQMFKSADVEPTDNAGPRVAKMGGGR